MMFDSSGRTLLDFLPAGHAFYHKVSVLTHNWAHGHFGGMQVACLLWQRVCSEKFPSRTSLSGGFGKEAFLCVHLLLGSKRAVSPKCGHEPFSRSIILASANTLPLSST